MPMRFEMLPFRCRVPTRDDRGAQQACAVERPGVTCTGHAPLPWSGGEADGGATGRCVAGARSPPLERAGRRLATNEAKRNALIGCLQARSAWIPNYRERRIEQKYIGSGHVEKANDLIVARRQKNRGMQWSAATSDGLAALRTLMLNGGWDQYWQQREVLCLLAS